ncbi:hypothetical protein F5884DRAFT_670294 [Xylogone sp. PMI_703]|nr:hypothetical protein F5884DRAFT_670294 [Xylogone sp. PMI_703]
MIQPSQAAGVQTTEKPFKFKYAQAAPCPPGISPVEWNKIYTAADSRHYHAHNSSAVESKKLRESGATRILALQILEERQAKAALAANQPPGGDTMGGKKTKAPKVKKANASEHMSTEASSSRDVTPGGDKKATGIAEQAKVEKSIGKASSATPSSSKQGTPVPGASKTTDPAVKEKGTIKKKGTAAPVRKIKKTETKGKAKASADDDSETDSSTGSVYCICRKGDNHSTMVECEGCGEWFHCSCMGIDEGDAKELLEHFACPKCKSDTLKTTYKRMCRYYNVAGCRKAAQVGNNPPSKYCSEEHARAFFEYVSSLARSDKAQALGGILSKSEMAELMKQSTTFEAFSALGQKPILPKTEGADASRPIGLDYLTDEEKQILEELKVSREKCNKRIEAFRNQQRLLGMMIRRYRVANKILNIPDKESVCGYDPRLAMNEAQFARYFQSNECKTAFETKLLGPRTPETMNIGLARLYPREGVPTEAEVQDELKSMCLTRISLKAGSRKKCRHDDWVNIHNEDYALNISNVKEELAAIDQKEKDIIEDAETREATKEYDAHNTVEVLF